MHYIYNAHQRLYRGSQGCAARDVTFSALTFPTYAYAKGALAAAGVVGPGALLLCGVLAAFGMVKVPRLTARSASHNMLDARLLRAPLRA